MPLKSVSSIAAAIVLLGAISGARAADPKKAPAAKKKSGDMLNDFDKQMQWENNVMGPDDKKAELAKIAKAQAITKAAAEKAAAEKAAAEKNPPKQEETAKRTPAQKNAAPVLLATPEDENAGKSTKSKAESARDREISPKLSTAEAAAPPPPPKPADDKFIDKLLKGEPKKKAKAVDDSELNDLLAKEMKDKPAAAPGKKKGGDLVDNLLRSAEKAPDMPAPKAKAPEWARPELATPAPTPRPTFKAPPKKDDGIIHVVQGAAGSGSSPSRPAAPARRGASSDPFDRDAAPRETASLDSAPAPRKSSARSASASADPFADDAPAPRPAAKAKSAPVASFDDAPAPRAASRTRSASFDDDAPAPRPAAKKSAPVASSSADPFADDAPPAPRAARSAARAQPARREPAPSSNSFDDPFDDTAPRAKAKRSAEAKKSGAFKDPFSEDERPAGSARRTPVVAMRDSSKEDSDGASRRAAKDTQSIGGGATRSGWAVLKKQSHR